MLAAVSRQMLYPSGNALLIPLLAIVFRFGSSATASVCYLLLALHALRGRVQAIQALLLSWLFSMISSGLAPAAPMASIGRYAVILSAAVSVFVFTQNRGNAATQMTFFLGFFFVVHVFFFSPIVDVSVLKATSWAIVVVTLIAAWGGLTTEVRARLADQIFGGLTILMIFSIPLLALPVGYLANGHGFQGVFAQPQVFGPAMALLGAWAGGQVLAQKRPSWSSIALLGACLVMVVLSEARTAGVALVLGTGMAVIMVTGFAGRGVRVVLPGLGSARFQLIA